MTNSPELSIIIPCYNCSRTLEEAVASCFRQGLSSFEIVMVNDRSTDDTWAVMKSLAARHPEVKIFAHDENKGGGATRNTAVEHSSAEVIFCLDSDDMLADGTLASMLALQREKGCDGVGINVSRKFRGTDTNNIETVDRFGYAGERVPLESLFQKGGVLCPLYSTFMFTKRAFAVAGGYPTAHGFDTQGFAWRFLGNGLVAYGCPDATYLHRVSFHESYYLREYNSGRVNGNWRMVLEEFLFLLSPDAQRLVINAHKLPFGANLMDEVGKVRNPLSDKAAEYAQEGAREKRARGARAERAVDARPDASQYWLGCFLVDSWKFDEARAVFTGLSHEPEFRKAACIKLALIREIAAQGENADPRSVRAISDTLYGVVDRRSARGIAQRLFHRAAKIVRVANIMARDRSYKPHLMIGLLWLKARKLMRAGFNPKPHAESDHETIPDTREKVDVIIPTASKDFDLLESVIDSLRMLRANTGTVRIIAPNSPAITEFCEQNEHVFVDEDTVLPGVRASISYTIEGRNMSGWLFQQLLKLKAADLVDTESYFVIDSDTVLIRPHDFRMDGKFVFQESEEWHRPYFDAFKTLFKARARALTSSVCHMMLFKAAYVKEMRAELEKIHGMSWEKAILGNLDYSKPSCFSEFETYANWMFLRHHDEVKRVPFYNVSLPRPSLGSLDRARKELSGAANSLSFHSYK